MTNDPEMLVGLSAGELEALSDCLLAPSAQGAWTSSWPKMVNINSRPRMGLSLIGCWNKSISLRYSKPEPDTHCSINRREPLGRDGLHPGGSPAADSHSILEPVRLLSDSRGIVRRDF